MGRGGEGESGCRVLEMMRVVVVAAALLARPAVAWHCLVLLANVADWMLVRKAGSLSVGKEAQAAAWELEGVAFAFAADVGPSLKRLVYTCSLLFLLKKVGDNVMRKRVWIEQSTHPPIHSLTIITIVAIHWSPTSERNSVGAFGTQRAASHIGPPISAPRFMQECFYSYSPSSSPPSHHILHLAYTTHRLLRGGFGVRLRQAVLLQQGINLVRAP